jgi:hypothetical protein
MKGCVVKMKRLGGMALSCPQGPPGVPGMRKGRRHDPSDRDRPGRRGTRPENAVHWTFRNGGDTSMERRLTTTTNGFL